MVSTPVPSTTGAAGILSTGTGLPPGPPRKRAPDGSIVTSLLADKSVTPAKLSTSLAHARQRYAAKSVGGSSSTDGAFASFTWDPGQDVTVSFVYASAVAPSATVTVFGAAAANSWNVRFLTTGEIEFREATTQRAITAAGVAKYDGYAHTVSLRVTGTTVVITHDGVSAGSGTFSSVTWGSTTYFIGAGAATSSQRWPGTLHNVEGTDHGTAANGFTFLLDEPRTAATFVNTLSGTSVGNAAKGTGRAFPFEGSVVSTDGRGMPWQSQGPLVYAATRASDVAYTGTTAYTLVFDTETSDPTGSFNTTTGLLTAPCAGYATVYASIGLTGNTLAGAVQVGVYASMAAGLRGGSQADFAASGATTSMSVVAGYALAAGETAGVQLWDALPGDTWTLENRSSLLIVFYPTPVAG